MFYLLNILARLILPVTTVFCSVTWVRYYLQVSNVSICDILFSSFFRGMGIVCVNRSRTLYACSICLDHMTGGKCPGGMSISLANPLTSIMSRTAYASQHALL